MFNADLLSTVLVPASRATPVVVQVDPTLPNHVHDPKPAGVVIDHISPVLSPSANAAPAPSLKVPSTTLDDQEGVTNSALRQSLNLGKELDVLTTSIPFSSAILTGSYTLSFLPVLKIEEPA